MGWYAKPSRNHNPVGFHQIAIYARERWRFTTVPNWKWNWSIRFVFGFIRFNPSRHTINVSLGTHLNNAHNIKWHALNQACVCAWVSFVIHLIHIFLSLLLIHNLCISIAQLYSERQYRKWQERKKFHMLQRSRSECIILLSKTETINSFIYSSRSVWESPEEWW